MNNLNELKTRILSGFVIYPSWLCEVHINQLDELITSGEKMAALDLIDDYSDGFICETCQALGAFKAH